MIVNITKLNRENSSVPELVIIKLTKRSNNRHKVGGFSQPNQTAIPELAQDESQVKLRPKEFSANADVRSASLICRQRAGGGGDKGIEGRKQVQR